MEKRKPVGIGKMKPLTAYFAKNKNDDEVEIVERDEEDIDRDGRDGIDDRGETDTGGRDGNDKDDNMEEGDMDTSGPGREDDGPGPSEKESEGDGTSTGTASKTNVSAKAYKYNPQWERTFKWLTFKEGKMYCEWCLAHPKLAGKNAFVTGDAQLKKDTVRKHAESRKHEKCRDAFISSQNKPLEKSVGRQKASVDEETRRQLKIKFNIAYYVAKEEIPFTKFPALFTLHKKNGVDLNPTYNNQVRCAEMIGQIADIMKEGLREKIEAAHYLAVLIDGDTDISNTECEIVYVRLLENGKPVNILVGQQAVEHAHALGVLAATKAAFAAVCEGDGESWLKKLASFGADGASVNMGNQGGVIAHLRREAGLYIIAIHCMPHRLELIILLLQKKEPKVAVVYDLLHLIWKTYHYSGKAKRELKALGQELGVDVHSPSNVKGTRWIPHIHRALKVFLHYGEDQDLATDPDQYAVVLQHMEHLAASQSSSVEVQGRAKKIKKEMESTLFCVFCHFLCDLFGDLAQLSQILQRNSLILPTATSEMRKTVAKIQALKTSPKPGGYLDRIQAAFKSQVEEAEGDLCEMRFQGMTLKGRVDGLSHPGLARHVDAAVQICLDALNVRFGSLVSDDGAETLLDSFKALNPDAWPKDQDSLLTFGNDSIEELASRFHEPLERAGCDIPSILEEWQSLKMLIVDNFSDKGYSDLWELLLTKEPYKTDYRNILELVRIMLLLPISAAQCERGFSAQNRIKSSTRNNLAVSTTEDLMRISLEGPPLGSWDPTPAVERWLSSKQARRPDYQDCWTTDILPVD